MKKIIPACFMALLMLLLPIATVAQTQDIKNGSKASIVIQETPKLYITDQDKIHLNNYVNTNFNEENIVEARSIVNSIINPDLEVDVIALANAITNYVYKPIPEEELTPDITKEELNALLEEYWGIVDGVFIGNPFSNLIDEIIQMIKDRLGWIYTLFTDGIALIKNGISLLTNLIELPAIIIAAFISLINYILSIPQLLAEILGYLFKLKFVEFINAVKDFIASFGQEINDFINAVKQFLQAVQDVVNYLEDIQNFINWINAEPWNDPIIVTGTVTKNLQPLVGVTVECKGETDTTDSNGEFSFSVQSTPDSDSIPPNSAYGMHVCQITVSENGEVLKETPKLLSYVFAGGKIDWTFLIFKGRSREINRFSIVENLIQRLQTLFPVFLKFKFAA